LTGSSEEETHIISSSKDTFLKLFELRTQHCMETVVGSRGEILDFGMLDLNDGESERIIISAGGDGEIRVWGIDEERLEMGLEKGPDGKLSRVISSVSTLPSTSTSATNRITQICFHPALPLFAFITNHEKSIEVYRVRSEEEIKKKLGRRKKREAEKKKKKKEKGKEKQVEESEDERMELDKEIPKVRWEDRIELWLTVRPHSGGKIKSLSWDLGQETSKKSGELIVSTWNSLFTARLWNFCFIDAHLAHFKLSRATLFAFIPPTTEISTYDSS
jgi:U3 small nucleolar RNA-associated protein 12